MLDYIGFFFIFQVGMKRLFTDYFSDDLVISSFGGSVPAFQGGKQRWIGKKKEN